MLTNEELGAIEKANAVLRRKGKPDLVRERLVEEVKRLQDIEAERDSESRWAKHYQDAIVAIAEIMRKAL